MQERALCEAAGSAAAQRPLRVGLQTWGSEGDVRPFLALGAALVRAGHDVTLLVTELDDRDYRRYEESLGMRIGMVASPVLSSAADLREAGEALLSMRSPYRQGRYIARQLFEPSVPEMYRAARELAAESDVVVRHFFHYPAGAAAELAGIPDLSVSFSPDAIPSAAQPPADLPDLGAFANRLLWRLATFALDRTFLPPVNDLRRREGLRPLPRTTDAWYSPRGNLLAMSPVLQPEAPDWGERHHAIGFLNLRDAGDFDPLPDGLASFLDAGSPPVLFGFGSLTPKDDQNRRETLEIIEAAVHIAGCRAVVQDLAEPGRSCDRIFHAGRLPHRDVYPRCPAIVHHAGAGTTQTALAAGVPSIGVPHLADQFYWSARLHRLGAASKPLKRAKMTPKSLASRITAVLSSSTMQARAQELGAAMRSEDGAAQAVRLIEQVAPSGHRTEKRRSERLQGR